MKKLKFSILLFMSLCFHMVVAAQTESPQSGYYWSEITANEGGTSANGNSTCISPVEVGYRTPTRLTFNEDGNSVHLSQEAPSENLTLSKVEEGVYELSRPTTAGTLTLTLVDRLIIVSDQEILREDLILKPDGGCQLSDTWMLTYSGEENPQEVGPLKVGAWALIADSMEGAGCADSGIFSNITVGEGQSRLQVSLKGHLIYGGYYMTPGSEEGAYRSQAGLDSATVLIQDHESLLSGEFNGGTVIDCRVAVTGSYVTESITDRLMALEASDPSIIPADGQWQREVLSVEAAENKPEYCPLQEVGTIQTASEFITGNGGDTIYRVLENGTQFPVYSRQDNGNYMNLTPSSISAMRVVSANELYEISQSLVCGTVYEYKRTLVP